MFRKLYNFLRLKYLELKFRLKETPEGWSSRVIIEHCDEIF